MQAVHYTWRGVAIASSIVLLWASCLYYSLAYVQVQWDAPVTYIWVLMMTHLYTGLFITAHDAMHGTVAPRHPHLNHAIGRLCALLDAYNNYSILLPKHHQHHRHVGTAADPDFHTHEPQHFWTWFGSFILQYVRPVQLLLMAITFNVLYRLFFPLENVLLYWMLPSVLSTLQLFYFGTYLPHRGQHRADNPHHSRSQRKNHLWAFLSCYFFGYHYEHHDSPSTPWWLLWQRKA